jgi:hypothetical protein
VDDDIVEGGRRMATTRSTVDLTADASAVWQRIGGFGGLPDWLPAIASSELLDGGRVRRLGTPDGATIVERLIAYDDDDRSYTYTIVESPFPVTEYRATLRVAPARDGSGCTVEWSGQFEPDGVSDEAATQIFDGIYRNGLDALTEHYAR